MFSKVVFSLCPLTVLEWWAVLKISFPVILLDEVLKYVARNFVDGKIHSKNDATIFKKASTSTPNPPHYKHFDSSSSLSSSSTSCSVSFITKDHKTNQNLKELILLILIRIFLVL